MRRSRGVPRGEILEREAAPELGALATGLGAVYKLRRGLACLKKFVSHG